jgi:hypothetical protein
MTRELTEIAVNRRQLSEAISKSLLNNFTSHELVYIAKELGIGDYFRLLELIKK